MASYKHWREGIEVWQPKQQSKGHQRSAKLQEPGAFKNFSGQRDGHLDWFHQLSQRCARRMRKVVAPTRRSPGYHFGGSGHSFPVWIFLLRVDAIFNRALQQVLTRLGGAQ